MYTLFVYMRSAYDTVNGIELMKKLQGEGVGEGEEGKREQLRKYIEKREQVAGK